MTNLSEGAVGSKDSTNENHEQPAVGVADLSLQQQHHQEASSSIGNTIAGVMGNVLEWYDFALFGFFADIIGVVFFPPDDDPSDNENLIKTFVIFGSAFLMRPIGGLLIGYVGDKHGRKEALTRSLFLMAIPTTLMGCLPTYNQIGVVSTIMLCLCRLVQGISVGGQLPASLVYTVEQRPKSTWGFYGSLPMVAANIGTLLGNLCGALMRQVLTEQQLLSWGWRLPFLSGIIIAFVAMYLKKYGSDEDALQQQQQQISPHHNPIKLAFRKENRLALLSSSLAPMIWASGFYVSFIWIAIYMEELMDPPIPHGFWINAISLLCGMTFFLPIAGHLSDRFGRVPMMTIAGVLVTVSGPFCLLLISQGNPWTAFCGQMILGILLSFYGGPLCAWLVESFSPEVRMTSASFGYDISHAIAGGFSPAIATALYTVSGSVTSAGLVYVVFGTLSVIGLYINYCCRSSRGDDLETDTGISISTTTTTKPPSSSATGDDVVGTSSLEMQTTTKIV